MILEKKESTVSVVEVSKYIETEKRDQIREIRRQFTSDTIR